MSIPVTIGYAAPDPSIKFTTISDLVTLFRTLTTAAIAGDLNFYVKGSATPSVDDQDKVWHKVDGAGRPIGTFLYYSGAWRREYSGLAKEVRAFNGDPTVYFDGTGLGIVGGYWDGWALMNGGNGTDDISDRFLVAGKMDNVDVTGYSGGVWRNNITGTPLEIGGNAGAEITLNADTTFKAATTAITAAHYSADGNTRDATGGIWGKDAGNGTGGPFDLIPADAGNPEPDPISILPPFYTLAYAIWVGYA